MTLRGRCTHRNAMDTEGLFTTPGSAQELDKIRECLDCGHEFGKFGVHSMAEALVRFFESLSEPVGCLLVWRRSCSYVFALDPDLPDLAGQPIRGGDECDSLVQTGTARTRNALPESALLTR